MLAYGKGAVCYPPADAVRLASLLATLAGLYKARAACEPTPHVEPH